MRQFLGIDDDDHFVHTITGHALDQFRKIRLERMRRERATQGVPDAVGMFIRAVHGVDRIRLDPVLLAAGIHSSVVDRDLRILDARALMNMTHPIQKHFMMEATEPGVREVQVGVQTTLWGLGWVIGPPLAGRILLVTGDDYSVLMFTTVAFYLMAGTLSWILLRPLEQRLVRVGSAAGPAASPQASRDEEL